MPNNCVIRIMPKRAFDVMLEQAHISDDDVKNHPKIAFISIISPDDKSEKHWFYRDHDTVLNLEFDDADPSMVEGCAKAGYPVHLFDYEDAKKIIAFIEKNKDATHFFIHCTAGVSRSGAVGFFVRQVLQSDYEAFAKMNPYIVPNGFVLQTLNDQFCAAELEKVYGVN